jgi:peptidoglycan biosynthesis protein MviN/MurJ (putative lipid II flippase)
MLSSGRHANTLLESVPALAILAIVLVIPNNDALVLALGTLGGALLHGLCLAGALAWNKEIEFPRFTSRSPQWPMFWQGFAVMLLGSSISGFTSIVDQFFASHLSAGAIATLSYANRILALIIGLGATSVSRATLPVFSNIQLEHEGKVSKTAFSLVKLMIAIGIIADILGWYLAPWMVKILFERGAFTAENTANVSEVLRYGLLQLPFYFSCLTLVALLASQQKYNLIAISGVTNLLVKTAANFILTPLLGVKGIAMGTGIVYLVSLFQLIWFASMTLKPKKTAL